MADEVKKPTPPPDLSSPSVKTGTVGVDAEGNVWWFGTTPPTQVGIIPRAEQKSANR